MEQQAPQKREPESAPVGRFRQNVSSAGPTISSGSGKITPEVFLILLYVLVTRLSLGEEARYGIWAGPVPIFPTDVTLILLIGLTLWRRRAWFQRWILKGKGAGPTGSAVWCLCILAVIYFVLAWPAYRLLAVRDLAMFGYSLYFPIAYVAIRDRQVAIKITRCLVYGTLVLGIPVAIGVVTGWNFALSPETIRFETPFGSLQRVPVGDLGPNLSYTFSAVLAYLLLKRGSSFVNVVAAVVSLIVIAAQLTRSGAVGVIVAAVFTFLFVGKRQKVVFAVLAGVAAVTLLAYSSLFQDLTAAVKSATTILDDPDVQFRLFRWAEAGALWLTHPVLGAGFGVEICTPDPEETGLFNIGMPHNSYLTLLARVGIVGFGLFLFCYGRAFYSLVKNLRDKVRDADSLAVVNILIAMGIYAGLNLFLEEPLLIAPFWIMLAVACRLAETYRGQLAVARGRSPAPLSSGQVHLAV